VKGGLEGGLKEGSGLEEGSGLKQGLEGGLKEGSGLEEGLGLKEGLHLRPLVRGPQAPLREPAATRIHPRAPLHGAAVAQMRLSPWYGHFAGLGGAQPGLLPAACGPPCLWHLSPGTAHCLDLEGGGACV